MELINKIRKSRKGFTLVEIIVVLVILAVLAAFTIPSMIGFVGEAKKKAAIAEQREVYVAAQAIVTERFAKNATNAPADLGMIFASGATETVASNLGSTVVAGADEDGEDVADQMLNYVNDDLTPIATTAAAGTPGSKWTVTVDNKGHIKEVTYTRDDITLDPLVPNKDI